MLHLGICFCFLQLYCCCLHLADSGYASVQRPSVFRMMAKIFTHGKPAVCLLCVVNIAWQCGEVTVTGHFAYWTVRLLFGHFAYWSYRLRDILPTGQFAY